MRDVLRSLWRPLLVTNTMLRHMFLEVLGAVAVVSLTLAVITLLGTTPRLFYLLAEGAIPAGQFALALAVLLPAQLYNFVPFAVTIAVIGAYARYGINHEIVSLRMVGLSDRALAMPAVFSAVIATAFAMAMSVYFVPISIRTFEDIVYAANFDLSLALLDEGYLQQVTPDLSISFRRRSGANHLQGVTILDGRKVDSFTYILADQAELVAPKDNREGRTLVLENGSYQVRSASDPDSKPIEFAELILPISDSPDGAPRSRDWRGTYEQPVGRLLDPPANVRADPSAYAFWRVEGHKRIILPLLCLSYAAFTVGVLLRGRYQRQNTLLRAAGIGASVALWHWFLIAIHATLVSEPALMPGYYLAAAVPGVIGFLLLASADSRARRTARRFIGRFAEIGPGLLRAD